MCLESVLIDSCGNFTLNIHPIRIFLSLFKSFWGILSLLKHARAREEGGGPHLLKKLETGRKKLVYQHVVPMATTSWHSDLCPSSFTFWPGPQYMTC